MSGLAKATLRILVFIATAYLAVLVILFVFQQHFLYPAPQYSPDLTPEFSEVFLQTEDGLRLRAFYRDAESGRPTIVYFHGNGGNLAGASHSNRALIEAGIGALLVEYRGYGGNPGEPSEAGFYLDGEAAMAWLNQVGIDPGETIITSNSIGGGVAVEMALRHRPAGLVMTAPFTSLPDAAQSNLWWLPAGVLVRDQYRNADKIAQLSMPIFIQHGSADQVVPHDQGERLAELAPDAEFQSFNGSRHNLSFEARSQAARRDWILALDVFDPKLPDQT